MNVVLHRNNMHLKRDMANAMRLDPSTRVENLLRFRRRLADNSAVYFFIFLKRLKLLYAWDFNRFNKN